MERTEGGLSRKKEWTVHEEERAQEVQERTKEIDDEGRDGQGKVAQEGEKEREGRDDGSGKTWRTESSARTHYRPVEVPWRQCNTVHGEMCKGTTSECIARCSTHTPYRMPSSALNK